MRKLRTLQTIAFVLIMGVVAFGAIVAVMVVQPNRNGPAGTPNQSGMLLPLDAMRLIAGGLLLAAIAGVAAMSTVIPQRAGAGRRVVNEATEDSDAAEVRLQIFNRFFISRITSLALFEGAALFGIVIVLVHGQLIDLGFAAVGLIAMAAQFPTSGKWRGFLAMCTAERHG